MARQVLDVSKVYHRCDPQQIPFETTAEVSAPAQIIGQQRATEAIQFGATIEDEHFHLYVLGPSGVGKHSVVRQMLDSIAQRRPAPYDWCYINNFEDPQKPRVLQLPAGQGKALQQDMEQLVEELQRTIPLAFEQEEYQSRLAEIESHFQKLQQEAFEELQQEAKQYNIAVIRTPAGFSFAPVRNGEVVPPEVFRLLPESERQEYEQRVEELQKKLQAIIRQMPRWRRKMLQQIRELDREVMRFTIEPFFEELRKKYAHLEAVQQFLSQVQEDIVRNTEVFRGSAEESEVPVPFVKPSLSAFMQRYQVNVLVTQDGQSGAPVVYEDHPTYTNLLGRIEHYAQFGTLMTNFTLIRPGSLHRANGGFLILDIYKVLREPLAWEGLKRALFSRQIRIQSLEQAIGLIATISLEPEPVPLDVKVVLIGDRLLFFLLSELDPDFPILFKVAADFEEWIEWKEDAIPQYAGLIATIAQQKQLLPFHREAVARIIEEGARYAAHAHRLTLYIGWLTKLMQEAAYWARQAGKTVVERSDVDTALAKSIYRLDRVRRVVQAEILNNTLLIDTTGAKVGQINGLAVLQLGEFAFGKPSRITATARVGQSGVVDIEREVKLGGTIHSKGVMILANYFTNRYSRFTPVVFSASLTFEQSYGPVEGDSASLAELSALISALTQLPIRQDVAVTGSVNQLGEVQPIGGVNEKIEGFFDICKARGLTGTQGVIIPATNVQHLMLRQDVQEAIAKKQFFVYAVETVDDALEILLQLPAGEPDEQGHYPPDSINGKIVAALQEFAEKYKSFNAGKAQGHSEQGQQKDTSEQ